MDKYEYNLKLEEIDKLVDQKDYEEAARMADTIEWKRVRNVRTLCLISEIYEAAGRLEDSKKLLLWAYRRSPVGRTVLYRLVEITTALHQYDEAMEYYTEYVQAAPHDNNRYILKYQIYRGRGASTEELITILEEYLGQEYTERWAYELAKLYQKAGQIQKCLATCDDLVLWFHSGKYVLKALELKKKYAPLTVKQQEILDQQLMDPEPEEPLDDEPDDVITKVTSTDGDVLAESIMAETEKTIADEVTAHKAELEQEMAEQADAAKSAGAVSGGKEAAGAAPEAAYDDKTLQMELARSMREIIAGVVKRTEEEEDNTPVITKRLQSIQPVEVPEQTAQPTAGRLSIDDVLLSMGERGREVAQAVREGSQEQNNEGAGAGTDAMSEDKDEMTGISETGSAAGAEPESMPSAGAQEDAQAVSPAENGASEIHIGEFFSETEEPRTYRTVAEDAEEELTDEQREALKYTNNPEKLLRNRSALPTYSQEDDTNWENVSQILENTDAAELEDAGQARERADIAAGSEVGNQTSETAGVVSGQTEDAPKPEHQNLEKTQRIDATRKELEQEMLSGKTIRVPSEKIAELHAKYGLKELWQEQNGLREMQETIERQSEVPSKQAGVETVSGMYHEQTGSETVSGTNREQSEPEAAGDTYYDQTGANTASGASSEPEEGSEGYYFDEGADASEETSAYSDTDAQSRAAGQEQMERQPEVQPQPDVRPASHSQATAGQAQPTTDPYPQMQEQNGPMLPEHIRGLFGGFTEIEGLEPQIANAVIQAVANKGDRTSRSGNILIFGPHGSGKTTLALGIAKAVAQDKGTGTLKLARIYATDLNRKDIAATIAKIAGGTLIIEEAGDLEPAIIEQLTTAMEFRTDGLLLILEDEEQYIHELLMNHPRFTMKFTSQIYLPVYTSDELLKFAQHAANEQGYIIGQEGQEELRQRVSQVVEQGNTVSVTDIVELVNRAIHKSNHLFRKMAMGKKRYDENDYIILFAKDFK